jgi:hypothetical protein
MILTNLLLDYMYVRMLPLRSDLSWPSSSLEDFEIFFLHTCMYIIITCIMVSPTVVLGTVDLINVILDYVRKLPCKFNFSHQVVPMKKIFEIYFLFKHI